jgi:hypothetical protein
LTDALEQQTATSEVLKIISSSPGDLQPVFNAMLENATRMCDAHFGILYRFANGAFQAVTLRDARKHSVSTAGKSIASRESVWVLFLRLFRRQRSASGARCRNV